MNRTRGFRSSDQLFVSWANPGGLLPPVGLPAHSTRSLATSWALFRGLSVQDVCAAASWSSPLTFVSFYMMDVSAPCMALDKLVWQYESEILSKILWKRTLGYLHNPGSLSHISEMSHLTTLLAWASEKCSSWMTWCRLHELFKVGGTTWSGRTHFTSQSGLA